MKESRALKNVNSLAVRMGILLFILFIVDCILFIRFLSAPSFILVKDIYNYNTLLIPIVLLAIGVIFIFEINITKRTSRILHFIIIFSLLFSGFGFFLHIYATYIEPHWLAIRKVTIKTDKVSRNFRILHISDIQAASIGSYEKKVFKKIKLLHPDMIIHTGDLLQPVLPATFKSEFPKLRALIDTLDPPLGFYGTFGNVDRAFDLSRYQTIGRMINLKSESVKIERDGTVFNLFGLSLLESMRYNNPRTAVEKWLKKSKPNDFKILFGHSPRFVLSISDKSIDICLAGHTHGGQIRLPFIGPIIKMKDLPRRLWRGFHNVGKTRINVSAGIGSEHAYDIPSIRINCPSEMTLITLKAVHK